MILIKDSVHKIDSSIWLLDEASNFPLVGGNKIRKLVSFLENKSFDGILSFGSKYSSHCLAVAYYAAAHNIPCILIIIENNQIDTERYPHLNLCIKLGAKLVFTSNDAASDCIDYHREQHNNFIWIPGGGHTNEGLQAYKELVFSVFRNNTEIHNIEGIYLPFGTGTTALGIAEGLAELKLNISVRGISVARTREKCLRALEIFAPTQEALRLLEVDDSFAGKYGEADENHKTLRLEFLKKTGFLLDPIYNVRVLEVLERDTPSSFMLINTGGQLNNLL